MNQKKKKWIEEKRNYLTRKKKKKTKEVTGVTEAHEWLCSATKGKYMREEQL